MDAHSTHRAVTLGLRKVTPYWYPHTTRAKGRWWGREILEIISTEFRDRSIEYYKYAIASGITTINGKVAKPGDIIQNGDLLENVTHRHEPPVTSDPVRLIYRDPAQQFIVIDKPGSIPVHPTGRYFKNSLIEILRDDLGVETLYTVNRLDRLTSGLMIIPTTVEAARAMTDEFFNGTVQKEYVARCWGEFPVGEVVCEEPLLTVDRQMGLNIVHPEGKHAKTIFTRLHYDAVSNTSVLHCRPLTGRSHQLRVHLQFLGHPIANDTLYGEPRIWGPKLGTGGLDLTPSTERAAPAPPSHLRPDGNPESLGDGAAEEPRELLPRETGHDIGTMSPVPLSAEVVGIITRLRNMKDEDEDWSRWRDVIFRSKDALRPQGGIVIPKREKPTKHRPPKDRKKKPARVAMSDPDVAMMPEVSEGTAPSSISLERADAAGNTEEKKNVVVTGKADDFASTIAVTVDQSTTSPHDLGSNTAPSTLPTNGGPSSSGLTPTEALARLVVIEPPRSASDPPLTKSQEEDLRYCAECYLPLHPDPKPDKLYIFLHALRYTTSLGRFETDMPDWAAEGWVWERE